MCTTVDLCFLCLTNYENLKSIFSQDTEGSVIGEKCRYVLNEYVNDKPEVSYHICSSCLKNLDYIYTFKQTCLQNITKLNNYIDTLRNFLGPNKYLNVTIADLPRLKETELTCCDKSTTEICPPTEVVVVKEEIAANSEIKLENVSEAEESMHEDVELAGKENSGNLNGSFNIQYSSSSCEQSHVNNFAKKERDETKIKVIHEEIYIKEEPLFEATDYDSDDNSNDKFQNEGANTADNIPTSSNYSENSNTSNNSTQADKKTKPYKCDACPKKFSELSALVIHKRVHTGERPFKCNYCDKVFTAEKYLLRHTHTHTGVKSYKCNICEEEFVYKTELILHLHRHTEAKPYECDICKQAFNHSTTLSRHKLSHTGTKPYQCDVCGKAFAGRSNLTVHKRIHTGKKPYECDECEKQFDHPTTLVQHKRVHTGERPYECDVCKKSFTKKNFLVQHKQIHNGKQFKCDVCNKAFAQLHGLSKHKKRVHKGNAS